MSEERLFRTSEQYAQYFENLLNIFRSNHFLDVELYAEGRSIKVHRAVLAANSSYFYNLLKNVGDEHSSVNHSIAVTDIKFQELVQLVRFLYFGEVSYSSSDEKKRLLELGLKYQIHGLNYDYANAKNNESFSLRLKNIQDDFESSWVSTTEQTSRKRLRFESGDGAARKYRISHMNGFPNTVRVPSAESTTEHEITSESFMKAHEPLQLNKLTKKSDTQISAITTQYKTYVCSGKNCKQSFEVQQTFVRHKRYKCGKTKEHQCVYCKKSFFLPKNLQVHKKKCTQPKLFRLPNGHQNTTE